MMAVKALTGFVTWLIVPELWLSHYIIWVKSPGLLTGLKFLSVSDLAMIAQHTSKNLWNVEAVFPARLAGVLLS